MEDEAQKEQSEAGKADHLRPWQFKPGQSGNPAGRPPGPSLKEWSRSYLQAMTDEERIKFMTGIDKKVIWEMAEGKPEAKTDITSKGDKIVLMPPEVIFRVNGTPPETEGGNQLDEEVQAS